MLALWGPGAVERVRRHTFVLFKPDGVVARCIGPAIACLMSAGFMPVHHFRFRFHRHTIRELWRYELNVATLQRLAAIDLLLPATDSVLVFLRDVSRQCSGQTAAERLRVMKGPSLIYQREPHHLRSRIGAGTGLLNLIHTPDESADVVREVGVLLDPAARRDALAALGRERPSDLDLHAIEEPVYSQAGPHDRDIGGCIRRIEAACQAAPSGPEVQHVLQGCLEARHTQRCDWISILNAIDAAGLTLEPWDRIVFAAACTEPGLPGVSPLLKK